MLLSYHSGPELAIIAALIGVGLTIALLVWSVSQLFEQPTRKRGLIGLGIALLIIGVVALVIIL